MGLFDFFTSNRKLSGEELFNDIQKYIDTNYQPKRFIRDLTRDRKSKSVIKRIIDDLFSQHKYETFSEKLMKLIKEKGKTPKDVYTDADITKQHFSKIKNNPDYRPTKETVLAFAVSLQLSLDETNDLLRTIGYTLSNSLKSDLIVEYFIKEKFYDIDEINYQLEVRGYDTLTNQRKMKDKDGSKNKK